MVHGVLIEERKERKAPNYGIEKKKTLTVNSKGRGETG